MVVKYELADDEVMPPRRCRPMPEATKPAVSDEQAAVAADRDVGKSTKSKLPPAPTTEGEFLQQIDELLKCFGPRRIAVPKIVRQITGSGDQAILLAQVLYWFARSTRTGERRVTPSRDGRHFVRKTYAEWSDETGIPERKVRTTIDSLVKKQLVERERHYFGDRSMTFLRPNVTAILARLA